MRIFHLQSAYIFIMGGDFVEVTAYINGVKVPREELKNYEIKNEGVKKILREAMRRIERERQEKEAKEKEAGE